MQLCKNKTKCDIKHIIKNRVYNELYFNKKLKKTIHYKNQLETNNPIIN